MSFTDFLWIVGWFLVGLYTFQIRGIKRLFNNLSIAASIISLAILILKPAPVVSVMTSIGLGYVSGLFTYLAYMIGANISRYRKFKRMSPRIILYTVSFFVLWMILETLL